MSSSDPLTLSNADPRVYGFDYTHGIVPNDPFDGNWAGPPVPSSEGEGEVLRMVGGVVRPQAKAQGLYRPVPTQPMYNSQDQTTQAAIPRYAASMPGAMQTQVGAYAGLVDRPQPQQPPAAHPSEAEHYPWKGHPSQGYSQPLLGPDGTSPMRRGGPNLPAYAVAPGEPLAYTGAVYPYTTPGVQEQNNGNPLFGGFSGVDFASLDAELGSSWAERKEAREIRAKERAASRKERAASWKKSRASRGSSRKERRASRKAKRGRTIRGKDGYYTYYQYASEGNPIKILVTADPSRLPEGTILQQGDRRWSHITAEIGTWAEFAAERRAHGLDTATEALTAISRMSGGKRRRRGRGRGRVSAYAPPPPGMTFKEEEEEESGLPTWVLPVGLVALVGIVAVFALGGKKS